MHNKYRFDPLIAVDAVLQKRKPATRCCCCCKPLCGIRWALGIFIWEAVFHIAISMARPLWEWSTTALTIFAFVLQDLCRFVLLVLSILACRGLHRGLAGAAPLRNLLRGLAVLFMLEMVEMALKFGEVHVVCNAPEVRAAHLARAKKYNLTGFNMTTGADDGWCEVFSDAYDFGWGVITLLVLLYVMYVVHSYLRCMEDLPPPEVSPDGSGVAVAEVLPAAKDAAPGEGAMVVRESAASAI